MSARPKNWICPRIRNVISNLSEEEQVVAYQHYDQYRAELKTFLAHITEVAKANIAAREAAAANSTTSLAQVEAGVCPMRQFWPELTREQKTHAYNTLYRPYIASKNAFWKSYWAAKAIA